MSIPDEAVEAAAEVVYGHHFDPVVREATTARLRKALEVAAPYVISEALDMLASEVRSDMAIPQRIYISRYIRAWEARKRVGSGA